MPNHQLVCQSCGSTDITIDPPYYQCNYCRSRYHLPEESLPKKEMIAWYRRRWRLLVVLTVFVAALTGAVIYNTLLLRSSIDSVPSIGQRPAGSHSDPALPPTQLSAETSRKHFKNIVFSTDSVQSIKDLIVTSRGTYLLGSRTPLNDLTVTEISAEGRILYTQKLSRGFYLSLAEQQEGGVIASIRGVRQHGETHYLDDRHRIMHTIPEGFAQIVEYDGGFVGVRGGMVARYDGKGKLVWRKEVDSQRYIARAGGRRDANGKTVYFSRQFDALDLRKLIRLKGGNFAAIGLYKRTQFATVIFSPAGEILHYRKIDLGRLYPDALYPAKDGGFILLARRGIQWLVFDRAGQLVEKKKLHHTPGRDLYGYAIAEDSQGYIVTYMEKGTMILARVGDDGSIKSRHRYTKPGVRLHPQKIVPAFDGGFLLAVNTEIHEPWLVKVDSDGRLDADLDDPTRRRAANKTLTKASRADSSQRGGDLLPSQTYIEPHTPEAHLSKQTIQTTAFLGSYIRDMSVSPDGKYLYAATGATGFKIFRLKADGSIIPLSNLLRTTSKLIITPHRISIAGGIPPHGTPTYYDAAYKVVINRAQTRAYVGDVEHGLYVVDITDKAHPRLLTALRGVKSVAFALSADERSLYLYDGTIHVWPIDRLAEHKATKLDSPTGRGDMVLLNKGTLLAIASTQHREILFYDTRSREVIDRYRPLNNAHVHALYTDADNNLYLVANTTGVEIEHVTQSGKRTPVAIYPFRYIHDLVPFSQKHTLCCATDKGVTCLDTKNIIDGERPRILYRDAGLHPATALAKIPGTNRLYMAFETPAIGRVEVKP